jgi:hypothetical protein
MPRFVILEHDHPSRHWDFMLEAGASLRAWRLAALPRFGDSISAEPSFNHRLLYLDFEGPLTGGRGRVSRWDAGEFEWQIDTADRLVVDLVGQRIAGTASIERLMDDSRWLFLLTEGEAG